MATEQQIQVTREVNKAVNLPAILRELLYVAKPPVLVVKDLAAATGKATSTISNKLNDQSEFTADEFIAISQAYASKGEFRLIEAQLPEGWSVSPVDCRCGVNGSLDDELGDLTELEGEARKEFEQGNREGVLKLIPRMRPILNRMEKEAKQ